MPELMDNNSFEQWQIDGETDAQTRGFKAARKLLDGYVPPPMDEAVDEALLEFIKKREFELPDAMS